MDALEECALDVAVLPCERWPDGVVVCDVGCSVVMCGVVWPSRTCQYDLAAVSSVTSIIRPVSLTFLATSALSEVGC